MVIHGLNETGSNCSEAPGTSCSWRQESEPNGLLLGLGNVHVLSDQAPPSLALFGGDHKPGHLSSPLAAAECLPDYRHRPTSFGLGVI